ncbi:ACT domain-containing protein [Inquilinus limosus]|uniref:Amino acid-binding protein n=1 Tax=Inquilinus limosus MP06 TaxID=1398085 RepID=A0A0A0D8J2_9PROT|nr:ACT domain-containing protein [Inquilinus limosus]KGM34469.1 amino acid-binding protein [Inquilinus limosus MP06]
MAAARLTLSLLPEVLAVARLPAGAALPGWVDWSDPFVTVSRTRDELSVVCPEARVPADTQAERGWRGLKVEGPLDFALTGILARLAAPLAEAGISIFAISTYDTDYLLVRTGDLEAATSMLQRENTVRV